MTVGGFAADPEERVLEEKDVPEIVREVLDAQNQSEMLGRVLKLPKSTVDAILKQYSGPKDQLFHVIDEFVKQVEPTPTWRVIADAVGHPLVGIPNVAKRMEEKYCSVSLNKDGEQYNFTTLL